MKNFVRSELEADNSFHFPSGQCVNRMNLGPIIKIAFELRHFTQKALDDKDSDEEEGDANEPIEKRSEMQSWFHFCNDKVAEIERIWNRKLDQPDAPVVSDAPSSSNDDPHDDAIDAIFKNFNENKARNLGRANTGGGRRQIANNNSELLADIEAGRGL